MSLLTASASEPRIPEPRNTARLAPITSERAQRPSLRSRMMPLTNTGASPAPPRGRRASAPVVVPPHQAARAATPPRQSRCSSPAEPDRHSQACAKDLVSHLDRMNTFSNLPLAKKLEVARALLQTDHVHGEAIVTQGEVGDRFYILVDGSVSVVKDNHEVNLFTGSSEAPQFFGERALLSRDARAASVIVTSSTAKTFSLDKASFDLLLAESLAGPRRVDAAVTRRVLEDARERHVLRDSYQARQGQTLDMSLVGMIRVEVFSDVLASVKASRLVRGFVSSIKNGVTDAQWRQRQRMQKWRCVARCLGKFSVLYAQSQQRVEADNAWAMLQAETLAVMSASLGIGSFRGGASFRLGALELKKMGIGSRGLGCMRMDDVGEGADKSQDTITLGGGTVAAALRSSRKALAKQGSTAVPRKPSSLLKVIHARGRSVA